MIVYTLQSRTVLNEVLTHGFHLANPDMQGYWGDDINDPWSMTDAYAWMSGKMTEKGILSTHISTYPIWGVLPNPAKGFKKAQIIDFLGSSHDQVLFKLDIPEDKLLMSSLGLWHNVLNFMPISSNEENWDEVMLNLEREFGTFPLETKPTVDLISKMNETWEDIFKIDADGTLYTGHDPLWSLSSDIVQVCFWEIRLNHIVSYWNVKPNRPLSIARNPPSFKPRRGSPKKRRHNF